MWGAWGAGDWVRFSFLPLSLEKVLHPQWPPVRKLGTGFRVRGGQVSHGQLLCVISLISDASAETWEAVSSPRPDEDRGFPAATQPLALGTWPGSIREGPRPYLYPGLGPATGQGDSGRRSVLTEGGAPLAAGLRQGQSQGGHPGLPRPAGGHSRCVGVARGSVLERCREPGTPAEAGLGARANPDSGAHTPPCSTAVARFAHGAFRPSERWAPSPARIRGSPPPGTGRGPPS